MIIKNFLTMFNTSNPNSYEYTTKHLEIHILGGIKLNKLESLRVTISIQKPKQYNIVRQSIDLYNDNQIEKLKSLRAISYTAMAKEGKVV